MRDYSMRYKKILYKVAPTLGIFIIFLMVFAYIAVRFFKEARLYESPQYYIYEEVSKEFEDKGFVIVENKRVNTEYLKDEDSYIRMYYLVVVDYLNYKHEYVVVLKYTGGRWFNKDTYLKPENILYIYLEKIKGVIE